MSYGAPVRIPPMPKIEDYLQQQKKIKASSQGWECPRCHRVWSPSVLECPCKPREEELRK